MTHQEYASNRDVSYRYGQVVDLASYGFEFGQTYRIRGYLGDSANVSQATDNAEATGDSSLLINIEVAIPRGDLDGDWDVDLFDFALFAGSWLEQW